MVRDIIFQGKRLDTGKWVYGTYGTLSGKEALIISGPYLDQSGRLTVRATYEVDPSTVGQYTGLKDSKNNMIWEGDILQINVEGEKTVSWVGYADNWAAFVVVGPEGCEPLCSILKEQMTVIGNRFDSLEQLEVDDASVDL